MIDRKLPRPTRSHPPCGGQTAKAESQDRGKSANAVGAFVRGIFSAVGGDGVIETAWMFDASLSRAPILAAWVLVATHIATPTILAVNIGRRRMVRPKHSWRRGRGDR